MLNKYIFKIQYNKTNKNIIKIIMGAVILLSLIIPGIDYRLPYGFFMLYFIIISLYNELVGFSLLIIVSMNSILLRWKNMNDVLLSGIKEELIIILLFIILIKNFKNKRGIFIIYDKNIFILIIFMALWITAITFYHVGIGLSFFILIREKVFFLVIYYALIHCLILRHDAQNIFIIAILNLIFSTTILSIFSIINYNFDILPFDRFIIDDISSNKDVRVLAGYSAKRMLPILGAGPGTSGFILSLVAVMSIFIYKLTHFKSIIIAILICFLSAFMTLSLSIMIPIATYLFIIIIKNAKKQNIKKYVFAIILPIILFNLITYNVEVKSNNSYNILKRGSHTMVKLYNYIDSFTFIELLLGKNINIRSNIFGAKKRIVPIDVGFFGLLIQYGIFSFLCYLFIIFFVCIKTLPILHKSNDLLIDLSLMVVLSQVFILHGPSIWIQNLELIIVLCLYYLTLKYGNKIILK